MQEIYEKQARTPGLRDRSTVPQDELAAYDRALALVQKYSHENSVARSRPLVGGEPYALPYRVAWTNAPGIYSAFLDAAWTTSRRAGKPGWYRPSDHEWVDLVLGFDAGYLALHAGHTPNAISAGITIDAMRAVRDGQEDRLSEDDRLVVDFVRAARDGQMNDDLWQRMISRLGSLEGTIALAYQVAILVAIQIMMSSFGVPAMRPEEWEAQVQAYESGERDPADSTQDWVWATIDDDSATRGTAE
ncbi:hypothetical protein [Aeromicrobium sp.]|jgi:hypothetical protein|uniref:hypothetical protein n=1 Tax=Aeromicrobium sp. TaxID=1871063 RepID=UPI0025BC5FAC|nr:hypothetical protein [Aeromicrobium sp.]MCK5890281.1 hypothetical protein [Aeromicrobium sp.]